MTASSAIVRVPDAPFRPQVDVSVVITVLNEAGTIGDLLASLAAQTVRAREVIVVDGGSRDGTQLHAEWWHGRLGVPLRIIDALGAGIGAGRNTGIAAATAPLIAATDAGVVLVPDWLARLVAPFDDPEVNVVSGWFVPDARTVFEMAMGATVLPALADVQPERFLPSSRSIAFRKTAWEAVRGYPEWLDYGEDLVFDLVLRDAGMRFMFAPEAVARFRPRSSLRAFWHQYFRYARGDGKAGLWTRRHAIRYGTYAAAFALIAAGRRGRPLWPPVWPIAALAAVAYICRPLARLTESFGDMALPTRGYAFMLVPCIRLVGDAAKMAGYPVGLWWRWRHHGLQWTWRDSRGENEATRRGKP